MINKRLMKGLIIGLSALFGLLANLSLGSLFAQSNVPQSLAAQSFVVQSLVAQFNPRPAEDLFNQRMNRYRTQLGLPQPQQIYRPKPRLSGAHPRYPFPQNSRNAVRQRSQDPRYAVYWQSITQQASRFAQTPPPASVDLAAEDPLRGYGNQLPWLAMAYLGETDLAQRQIYWSGLLGWLQAMQRWGIPQQNLAISQFIFGIALTYDWLYDTLPDDLRTRTRQYLVELTRFLRSPTNKSSQEWRGRHFTANHNWWQHAALAMSAVALWGETGNPLQPGEQQVWLDEAMQNFWIVRKTFSPDGAPLEGYLYQAYGDRPYLEFAILAEHLTTLSISFLDIDAFKNRSTRLYALLPEQSGFISYADSYPREFAGGYLFRYLASRFRDQRAQLLAQILEESGQRYQPNKKLIDWHGLLWYDPRIPAVNLASQPLSYDWPDLGLFVSRSSWTAPQANLIGFKCGAISGQTVTNIWGNQLSNGHIHPDAGNFSFYWGAHAVIPPSGYARTKLTRNHNLILIEGKDQQQGHWVGQVGEGGAWFGHNLDQLQRQPKLLKLERTAAYSSYLCDLGGLYWLQDQRVPGGQFFPEYRRRLTYLPSGAVVIVDRITTPVPRTFQFRLLTSDPKLSITGKQFQFTLAHSSQRGEIIDVSPTNWQRTTSVEQLPVWANPQRGVAMLTAPEQTRAVFAVVLGVDGSAAKVKVQATPTQLLITDVGGQRYPFSLD